MVLTVVGWFRPEVWPENAQNILFPAADSASCQTPGNDTYRFCVPSLPSFYNRALFSTITRVYKIDSPQERGTRDLHGPGTRPILLPGSVPARRRDHYASLCHPREENLLQQQLKHFMKLVNVIMITPTHTHTPTYTCTRTHIYIYNIYIYNNYIYIYAHTHTHTYVHTYIHTYLPTYLPTYLRTYVRTYVRTYMHTCIHAYIHTYMHCMHHTYIHTYI